jgi:PAS domain S-box-containing protein
MSGSLGLIWGVVIVTVALLILSAAIVMSLIIHTRKMRESEQRFRLLFERAFDSIILADDSGVILDTNQATCVLLGHEKPDLIGQPVLNHLFEEDTGRFQMAMKKALSKGSEMAGELLLRNKAGAKRYVEGVVGHFVFLETHYLIISFRDLTERLEASEALKTERRVLYEKNVALREVLQHIEEEKTEARKNIAERIDQVILPLVRKMGAAKEAVNEHYYLLLEDELKKLSGFSGGASSLYYKLSPREIEICGLIKMGATTKEIAKTLNISVTTVNKHRERIRNRLDISRKDVNLTAFLQNLQ